MTTHRRTYKRVSLALFFSCCLIALITLGLAATPPLRSGGIPFTLISWLVLVFVLVFVVALYFYLRSRGRGSRPDSDLEEEFTFYPRKVEDAFV